MIGMMARDEMKTRLETLINDAKLSDIFDKSISFLCVSFVFCNGCQIQGHCMVTMQQSTIIWGWFLIYRDL